MCFQEQYLTVITSFVSNHYNFTIVFYCKLVFYIVDSKGVFRKVKMVLTLHTVGCLRQKVYKYCTVRNFITYNICVFLL